MKIRIGLEAPETQEVKTYMEQLQGKLAAAQKELDNATTIEARVAANAKVDEIQAEIDTATKGEVSIKAAVEPSYIQKGSVADKRQSYQNAQSNASQVQQDFEIGIIGNRPSYFLSTSSAGGKSRKVNVTPVLPRRAVYILRPFTSFTLPMSNDARSA